MDFEVGDLVSRDGTDVHRVDRVYFSGLMLKVTCVTPSAEGWCKVGDVEDNLSRRYELVERGPERRRLDRTARVRSLLRY